MKRLVMVCAALGFMAAEAAHGLNIRYKESGDWFDISTTSSNGNGWVSVEVPGSNDIARANWADNTITLSGEAPTVDRFQWGVDESGGVIVEDGGVLTTLRGSKVGNNNLCEGRMTINTGGVVNVGEWCMVAGNTDVTGKLVMNGGTLNITSHLWIATGTNSTGFVEINDGTINVGGIIGVGSVDFQFRGGVGRVDVKGGVLALNNIFSGTASNEVSNVYLPSVMPGSLINIERTGLITLPGDFLGTISNYVEEGKIVAYNDRGTVEYGLHVDGGVTSTVVWAEWGALNDVQVSGGDVVFSWDSWRLEQYTVEESSDVTDPGAWTPIPGLTNLPGIEAELVVTSSLASAEGVAYRVALEPPSPQVIYATDFEGVEGTNGWSTGTDSNTNTLWELGTPANTNSGPLDANSPTNAWGTNIADNYGSNANCWLRSPSIDLSEYPSAQLTFYDARQMELLLGNGAFGIVNIYTNGVFAQEVFRESNLFPWTERVVPLPPELLTDDVVVEFRFTSDGTGAFANRNGWLIDDVSLDYVP